MRAGRDTRIDLVRGLSLLAIFVGHSNVVFSEAFQQSRGFSDASELFVLMAGMSCGLAYFTSGHGDGALRRTFARTLQRACKLYAVHVAMVTVLAIALLLPVVSNQANIIAVLGMAHFWDDPALLFFEVAILEFMPGDLDILPLYIVLLPVLPVLFYLYERSVLLLLGICGAVWLVVGLYHLNFVNLALTNGHWYFDPLSWQLVFAIGVVLGVRIKTDLDPLPYHRTVFMAAAAFALMAVPANIGLHFYFTDLSTTSAYHALSSKIHVGVLRLINAVSIVYVVWNLDIVRRIDPAGPLKPIYAAGRHSLPIFVVGLFLSTLVAMLMASDIHVTIVSQVLMIAGGCLVQVVVALRLDRQKAKQDRIGSPASGVSERASGRVKVSLPAFSTTQWSETASVAR